MIHSDSTPRHQFSSRLRDTNIRLITPLIFLILLATSAAAQHRKLLFQKISLQEARVKAAQEHKLLFLDVITSWCGPCKNMEKTVFTNDSVADYYNANFLNIKLDLERGEGLVIDKQFDIRAVPTYLFLDSAGNLVYKMLGAMSASQLVAHGKTANNPEKNLVYYQNHFPEKKDNLQFLEEYLQVLMVADITSGDALKAYISLQKDELVSEKNWKIIKAHARDIYSDEFAYLMTNRKAFAEKTDSGEVTDILDSRIRNAFDKIVHDTNTFKVADFTRAKDYVASLNYEQGGQLIFEAELELALVTKNWDAYALLCLEKAEFYYLGKPTELSPLSEIASHINEHFGPGKLMDKAEFWAKIDAERDPYYFSCLTYAQILYRNNKNEEALAMAKKARKFAMEMGDEDSIKSADELLKKIYKKTYTQKKSG